MVGISISNSIQIAGRRKIFNVRSLINFFIARIENDGGTFESEECLKQYLNLIQ